MIALVEGPLQVNFSFRALCFLEVAKSSDHISFFQGAMHIDHPWLNVLMGPKCLTHTLEWNLRICLLDRMFDEDYRVDPHFLQRYE